MTSPGLLRICSSMGLCEGFSDSAVEDSEVAAGGGGTGEGVAAAAGLR